MAGQRGETEGRGDKALGNEGRTKARQTRAKSDAMTEHSPRTSPRPRSLRRSATKSRLIASDRRA